MNFRMIVSDNFLFFLHFAKFGILKVFGGNFEILVFWTLGTKKCEKCKRKLNFLESFFQ